MKEPIPGARLVAALLCCAILLTSPGPSAYAAGAQIAVVRVAAPVGAPAGAAGVRLGVPAADGLRLGPGLANGWTGSVLATPGAPELAAGPAGMVRETAVAPVLPESGLAVLSLDSDQAATAPAAPMPAAPAEASAPGQGSSVEGAREGSQAGAGQAELLGRAEAVSAEPGRFTAAAGRVRSALRNTISALFSGARDAGPIAGSQGSEQTGRLEAPTETSVGRAASHVEASAPAVAQAPARSPSKAIQVLRWAGPILALTALVFGLDVGTKFLAAKFLFTAFHECAWRAPFLAVIIPFIATLGFKARANLNGTQKAWRWSAAQIRNGRLGFYREEISSLDDMIKDHPCLVWARRIFDLSIALMLGGMLGNGLDALRLGGALDWIPLGRSLMNFADVALLPGLAIFQLMTRFFMRAGAAHRSGKPLHFNSGAFLGLPILGFFIAWTFGSAPSDNPLSLSLSHLGFVYLMGFSMLVGISRLLAMLVVDRFAARFIARHKTGPEA